MNASSDVATIPGWYGKLPTLGDFASRRLEADFIEPWDLWLGEGLQAQRQSLGEAWLDAYLDSPPWRFLLSPGVLPGIDPGRVFAGVLMPSVDRVGRYFPLTIAASLARVPGIAAEFEALLGWLHRLEDAALDALQGDWSIDDLERALAAPAAATRRSGGFRRRSSCRRAPRGGGGGGGRRRIRRHRWRSPAVPSSRRSFRAFARAGVDRRGGACVAWHRLLDRRLSGAAAAARQRGPAPPRRFRAHVRRRKRREPRRGGARRAGRGRSAGHAAASPGRADRRRDAASRRRGRKPTCSACSRLAAPAAARAAPPTALRRRHPCPVRRRRRRGTNRGPPGAPKDDDILALFEVPPGHRASRPESLESNRRQARSAAEEPDILDLFGGPPAEPGPGKTH